MSIRNVKIRFNLDTPAIVNSLIDRIEAQNNGKSSGHCYVKVDIYFSAVGMIGISTAEELSAIIEEIKKDPKQLRYVAQKRKRCNPSRGYTVPT